MTLDRERLLAYLTELTAALEDWDRYRARATRDLLGRDRDTRNMVLHYYRFGDVRSRRATAELSRWLTRALRLTPSSAAVCTRAR
jgi:hypothetical protein